MKTLIKSDRYQEDVLETYLTPAYSEDRLYDDLYDCQKHNYLVRKYFKEGLRGDDLINAVTDTINEDIADWDCTAWQGLDEEADEFDPQDLYDESIQSSRRIRSSYPKNAEQNKFNWAYNSSLKGKDDLQPYEYEYIRWYNKNENEPWMKELCEKYDCYPLGDTEKAAFGSALREIGEIQSSRKNIRSSQKGFENVADNTQYDDYHIDTRGMGILDVENIVNAIESRGNQAVLTVNCSDGSAYHTQFTLKDWKEFKESKNANGAQVTDVWITEVKPSYVRNSKMIKSGYDFINRVPDGINLFLYSKDDQAKDKRYFPVGNDWGQTDRLMYARMFDKDSISKVLAAIEPQLPEGMSIQVRDAKGKVYYTFSA